MAWLCFGAFLARVLHIACPELRTDKYCEDPYNYHSSAEQVVQAKSIEPALELLGARGDLGAEEQMVIKAAHRGPT